MGVCRVRRCAPPFGPPCPPGGGGVGGGGRGRGGEAGVQVGRCRPHGCAVVGLTVGATLARACEYQPGHRRHFGVPAYANGWHIQPQCTCLGTLAPWIAARAPGFGGREHAWTGPPCVSVVGVVRAAALQPVGASAVLPQSSHSTPTVLRRAMRRLCSAAGCPASSPVQRYLLARRGPFAPCRRALSPPW